MIRFIKGMALFYGVMASELAHTIHERWKASR